MQWIISWWMLDINAICRHMRRSAYHHLGGGMFNFRLCNGQTYLLVSGCLLHTIADLFGLLIHLSNGALLMHLHDQWLEEGANCTP